MLAMKPLPLVRYFLPANLTATISAWNVFSSGSRKLCRLLYHRQHVFSVLRFLSDRATMTDMYAISQTGHNLHQEPINMALSFAVASSLALLIYRRIQLGPTTQLLDPGIVAPLSLLILYILFLLYARVKLDSFLPGWFRRLLKLGSRSVD
jgi:hypothetical protein